MDKTDAQKIKFNCFITHPPQRLQIDGFVITVVKNLFTALFQMSIFGQKILLSFGAIFVLLWICPKINHLPQERF